MNWNPYMKYTWTKANVDSWIQEYGSTAFYGGKLWRIFAKRIVGGYYSVHFEEV